MPPRPPLTVPPTRDRVFTYMILEDSRVKATTIILFTFSFSRLEYELPGSRLACLADKVIFPIIFQLLEREKCIHIPPV